MKIAEIRTTVAETDGVSATIWVHGCKGTCVGCCNPNLKDFSGGRPLDYKELEEFLSSREGLIDSACILGGDLCDQNPSDASKLLATLRKHRLIVWVYTRMEIDEVPPIIKLFSDYIKTGPYESNLSMSGYRFGSTNQRLFKKVDGKFNCVLRYDNGQTE